MATAIKLPTLTCKRCGYSWHPRLPRKPKNCPNPKCNSPYWDKERQVRRHQNPDAPKVSAKNRSVPLLKTGGA